jgi:D-sedoheptulose 7-phosphate isomerase
MKAPFTTIDGLYHDRAELVRAFFDAEAERLASLCHEMAGRFASGGRLIAFGAGAAATDAQHVSVEFVHPVIVGKRALPAIALVNDAPTVLGLSLVDSKGFFARQLDILGTPRDVALGIVHGAGDPGRDAVDEGLRHATALGMLVVSLAAGNGAAIRDAHHTFAVPSDDPLIVQEVHETLYHVLWELVHVFFEHKGLLEDRTGKRSHDTGPSSFLYPFLAEAESNLDRVLDEVRRSILKKAEDVIRMRASSMDVQSLMDAATAMAQRIGSGGKVLAFGNGGSATDAQDFVTDLMCPPLGMSPIPAMSLTNEDAVVTAVGNDVGFDNVFARQVIAYGELNDVAVAISTSGGSRNVLAAIDEARRRGLLTVALAGYGGGRLVEMCDVTLVVHGDYIPRIQEAQATHLHVLRGLLDAAIGGPAKQSPVVPPA